MTMKLPTLFSKFSSKDKAMQNIMNFFVKENGSIAVSQAKCTTHRVDISRPYTKKLFTLPFLDALRGLEAVSTKSGYHQLVEFRRFIDEFGTHYSKRTILGVRLLSERRYTANERDISSDSELKRCNTISGVKVRLNTEQHPVSVPIHAC